MADSNGSAAALSGTGDQVKPAEAATSRGRKLWQKLWPAPKGQTVTQARSPTPTNVLDYNLTNEPRHDEKLTLDPALRICDECARLVADAFSWRLAKVKTRNTHHDNSLRTLEAMADSCQLCAMMAACLRDGRNDLSRSRRYWITRTRSHGFAFFWAGSVAERRLSHVNFLKVSPPRSRKDEASLRDLRPVWQFKAGYQDNVSVTLFPEDYPFSREAISLAIKWLANCRTHCECGEARNKIRNLPKRVLDLSGDGKRISLHVPREDETAEYATLSYCWGISGVPLKTTTSNLEHHRNGISVKSLPKTLRDAVHVARILGIRYLWIDSLCIIQEGDGGRDWAEQAAAMTSIYQGGLLNISAVDGANCEAGLQPKTLGDRAVFLGVSESCGSHVFASLLPHHVNDAIDQGGRPLSKRGWVLQERLASPATLHFTDNGMVWECCLGNETELTNSNIQVRTTKWRWSSTTGALPTGVVADPDRETALLTTWYLTVEIYSKTILTFETDRLPAVAGIAAKLSRILGLTYLAGMWIEDLAYGLCWVATNPSRVVTGSGKDRVPTWSWISTHGVAILPRDESGTAVFGLEVHGTRFEEEHPGSYGFVRNCRLDVSGTIWEVNIVQKPLGRGTETLAGDFGVVGLLEPWMKAVVSFYNDHIAAGQSRLGERDSLECLLLLVREVHDFQDVRCIFLVLEEAEDTLSDWGPAFRRVGLLEVAWFNDEATGGCLLPGMPVKVSLV
ncbi:heterokaryon incompatibility protein-domain-containing protein [Podospora aff. communis PSN243]|uniref:Heterokaryon incompatibility protein-domain-containing protein n=1 Tax=Podospora aff. communis PSN243 TaxID=3040156 RepID=A0AAV9G807_9PEZI|nr:heterokaryon incompatibility protein-domain-containing protein [Podospora aff. communis PSN243]